MTTTRVGTTGNALPATWLPELRGAQPAPAPAVARNGWYTNSYQAEGHAASASTLRSWGDAGGLWTPQAGKPSYLATLLGKLPAWEKQGAFQVGTAGKVYQGAFSSAGGLATGSGRLSLLEASAGGSGSVAFKGGALAAHGELHAQATLIDAQGRLHLGKGPYTLDASASAFVGAKAHLDGELVLDLKKGIYAAKVGGEAFVGARAGAEANVKLGKFGTVGGRAEAWAGVGASFHLEAGFSKGRFKARFDIGAALGIGFKLGFNVDINLKGIIDAIKKPFTAIKDALKGGVGAVKKAASTVVNAVKDVGSKVVDGVKSAAKSVGNFFKKLF